MSFETLLYSQWRQQCFFCFRKFFVCLWVNFYFWKIKSLVGVVECLTEVLETVLMEVYVHWAKFSPFFSCRLICPSHSSIRLHNHNFLNFYWSAAISLAFWDQLWQICAMMYFKLFFSGFPGITEWNYRWCCTMLAIAWSAFLNAVYHDICLCCVSVLVLIAEFSTSISWQTKFIGNIRYVFPKFSEVICLPFLTPGVPHMACHLEFPVSWDQQ